MAAAAGPAIGGDASDGASAPPRSQGRTIVAFAVGAVLVGMNAWLAAGAYESVAREGRAIDYVLVSRSWGTLAVCILASAGALLTALALRQPGQPGGGTSGPDIAWVLQPLRWLALSLVPLLALLFPLGGRLASLLYTLWDLRWYWWTLVAIDVVRRAWRWRPVARAWLRSTSPTWLAIVPVVSCIVFTPNLRFSGVLHGDEPKYIRFCENFYQGLGFDVSDKRLLVEASGQDYPRLGGNISALVRAVPEELSLLGSDARRLLTGKGGPRLVGGAPSPNMFFAGKHPGTVYQLHSPGLSFILLPGYLLDRLATGGGVGYQGEFPETLPAVHLTLLALFTAYIVTLQRLLTTWCGSPVLAGGLAAIGGLTLPASAFAFQIYPEVAAGIALFVLVRAVVARERLGAGAALAYGLLAGFLPWLHIRFMLAGLVSGCAMLMARRQERRFQLWFVCGAAVPLVLLSLYTYRLTGSLIPVATYGPDTPLFLPRMAKGVVAFWVERVWGLLPHTPLYLVAALGVVRSWQRAPAATGLVVLTIAAVVVPAAGHGYWAGGSTPGRYLVSVAPLLLLFAADAIACCGRRRLFAATVVVLALVSVETAVRYNLHHVKEVGPLVAREFSGWRVNLLFPSLGTDAWTATAPDLVALLVWVGLLVALGAAGWVGGRLATGMSADGAVSLGWTLRDVAAGLLLLAAFGAAASVGRDAFSREFLMPAKEARERLLIAFSDQTHCTVCYSSSSGAVPPTDALGNRVDLVDMRAERLPAVAGTPVRVRVRPRSPEGEYVVATVRLDFGDGTIESYNRRFGDVDQLHVYATPGEYTLRAWVRAADEQAVEQGMTLAVAAVPADK